MLEEPVDVVISTEMLEHDEYWKESLRAMLSLVKPDGLILFTCATHGRPEHGTKRTSPQDAPYVSDYYMNLGNEHLLDAWGDIDKYFSFWQGQVGPPADLRFWGIRNDVDFTDEG
jgi:hypothetical protein